MRDSYFFGKKLAAGTHHLTGVLGEIGALDVVFDGQVVVNCMARWIADARFLEPVDFAVW